MASTLINILPPNSSCSLVTLSMSCSTLSPVFIFIILKPAIKLAFASSSISAVSFMPMVMEVGSPSTFRPYKSTTGMPINWQKASCKAISIAAMVPGKCGNCSSASSINWLKKRISLPTSCCTKSLCKLANVMAGVSPTTSANGLAAPIPVMPLSNTISKKTISVSAIVL